MTRALATLGRSFPILLLVMSSAPAVCQVDYVDLKVPIFGEEAKHYCGAASAQMIMMGYPDRTTNRCFDQTLLFHLHQVLNLEPSDYSTDPAALARSITLLNPPPGGNFRHISDYNPHVVMNIVVDRMIERGYPSAILNERGDHWVVVTGFLVASGPDGKVLRAIELNDPANLQSVARDDPCTPIVEGTPGGHVWIIVPGSWFFEDNARWWGPRAANRRGQLWLGKYVAVTEPPVNRGQLRAERYKTEPVEMSVEKALEIAKKSVLDSGVAQRPRFKFVVDSRTTRAFLVNRGDHPYYLVPFEDPHTGLALGAVLLNGGTGEIQETGAYTRPIEYLESEDAIRIAWASVRKASARGATAELVYEQCFQTKTPYSPVWKVTLPSKPKPIVRYVTQGGLVSDELTALPRGGS